MSTIHEDLVGGVGRSVYYRAKRMLVRNFLNQQDARVILPDGVEYALHDISMNGLSFRVPGNGAGWTVGQILDVQVALQDRPQLRTQEPRADDLDRQVVFSGRARVARADGQNGSFHIGLHLVDSFLNLPQVQWNYAERMLRRDLDGGPQLIRQRVPPDYREVIERATFFLQFYKQSLNKHELRYAEMGESGKEALRERAPAAAVARLRHPWDEIRAHAARAISPHLGDVLIVRAAKRYTETVLTPILLGCPFVHRSYTKPLGYAGDYDSMLQIYRNAFEGGTLFDRVFHRLACGERLATGVRGRKEILQRIHDEEYDRFTLQAGKPSDVFRVTSLGSGPAREVADFVRSRAAWERSIHWTLVDQEEEALSLTYHDLYPMLANSQPPLTLRCMHMSFSQFLTDSSAFVGTDKQQDFIYTAGLFDYINENRARTIVRELYEQLAPGGLLAVANALRPNDHFWFAEFVLDWSLIYRTESEMLALAGDVPPHAERNIVTEPAGAFHLLLVRKR